MRARNISAMHWNKLPTRQPAKRLMVSRKRLVLPRLPNFNNSSVIKLRFK
jgi:hypothetical protein